MHFLWPWGIVLIRLVPRFDEAVQLLGSGRCCACQAVCLCHVCLASLVEKMALSPDRG